MKNIDVSVVIVNYNTLIMTQECIDSIFKVSRNISFEVILVDNASTDGSKEHFSTVSQIKYLYNEKNLGFGCANNVGVKEAIGKYIFLLNSDTILLDNVIKKIFDFAERCPEEELGAIGTCLVDGNMQDTLSFSEFLSSKRIYRKLFEKLYFYNKSKEAEIYDKLRAIGFAEVDFITGANLFVPRKIFNKIDGFDPDFFMYYEETDLEKRMDSIGLKRFILNLRDIIHLEGGSFGVSIPFRRKMMMLKGMKIYINKHFKGISKLHILFLSLITLLKDLPGLNYSRKENIALIKEIFYSN